MFKNRIRLPLYTKAPQFPAEANRFRLANGESKTLSVVIRKTYNLVTDYLPERMHQRLTIALNHDEVNIEGDRYVGGVSVDGEYKIEWLDFLDYPLAQAEVQIQVTPFAATNDNCQTCEEATQLETVDDIIPDTVDEGEVVLVSAFDNDTICCFPFTAEIVSFNTDFVDSAVIDPVTGVVTITIKNPAPLAETITLVTYRVTCPNGVYDEADIKGTVLGTIPGCEVPTDLEYTNITEGTDVITWTGAGDFEWELYTCDNLGTPVQTGTSTGTPKTFNNLDPGQCYRFVIRKDCGGGSFSAWTNTEFTVPVPENNCGEFEFTANDGTTGHSIYNASYMNCNGTISNNTIPNLSTRNGCLMVDSNNDPIYFEGDPEITYIYIGPC